MLLSYHGFFALVGGNTWMNARMATCFAICFAKQLTQTKKLSLKKWKASDRIWGKITLKMSPVH